MAESTLTLTRLNLYEAVGRYLGISRTVADWTAENTADVAAIVAIGLRQFYAPTVGGKSHVWSFLTPVLSVSLTNGTHTYTLADDFAGFVDEELAFTTSKTWSLKLVPIWRVLEKQQDSTSMPAGITQPLIGAVQPKTFTAATGQRWELVVWPTPTSSLTVKGRYRANPDAIAADGSYPLGGEQHAETVLASVLCAAEEQLNDGHNGPHRQRFNELLAASIERDMRLHRQEAA